jgi:hypothetical protein
MGLPVVIQGLGMGLAVTQPLLLLFFFFFF